jgi:hypothetical protein|tara:strand:+ start:148 stop:456 length:309 start_codon:yes stop_codon:yes gene_type:complete
MSWRQIFKDGNDYNEKSIIGFLAFVVMVIVMLADVITGMSGTDLIINDSIYNSFVMVVLGCFGIAGIEKFAGRDKNNDIKCNCGRYDYNNQGPSHSDEEEEI